MVTINKVLRGLTPLTARSIIKFIGSKEAKEGIGWFTDKEVDKILCDETSSNSVQEKLKNIQQEFEDIKVITSMKKTNETKFDHVQTRIVQAEMDICHKFQLLQSILSKKESNEKGESEIKRLRDGILDPNIGILNNLSVIHQELVGQTVDPTKKGLLEIWYKGVCNNMTENPISAKSCYDMIMKHLTKVAILQLKGFLLFNGANENSQFCLMQFKYLENNLKSQSDVMDKTVSHTMKYLADPSKENKFYLRTVSGVRFEPFVRVKQKTLVHEYHLQNNEEKKWIFEKSSTFENDGSLFIYCNSNEDGKRNYISVKDFNKTIIVSREVVDAQPFFVMPRDVESSTKITICLWLPQYCRLLGYNLKFTEKKDNIEFTMTMTKPHDMFEKEHKWDILFHLINWLSKTITKFQ